MKNNCELIIAVKKEAYYKFIGEERLTNNRVAKLITTAKAYTKKAGILFYWDNIDDENNNDINTALENLKKINSKDWKFIKLNKDSDQSNSLGNWEDCFNPKLSRRISFEY